MKDEDWKLSSRGGSSKSYDLIDSGRGSSNGYHSSSDTFSPLSNASLGSRSSPPNMKPESDCSKMFGNGIWSSEPKTVSLFRPNNFLVLSCKTIISVLQNRKFWFVKLYIPYRELWLDLQSYFKYYFVVKKVFTPFTLVLSYILWKKNLTMEIVIGWWQVSAVFNFVQIKNKITN